MTYNFRVLFLLAIQLFIINFCLSQYKISGKITDTNNEDLGFVSIYIQNSTNGTLANEKGEYYLKVTPGKITIIVQHLGYISQSKTINVSKDEVVNFVLSIETFHIDEVVVNAGEDPAVPIMKKAIKKRPAYLDYPNAYQAELYIKALMKIVDAPKTFLGQELGNMEGILDSSRQGILYFSESLSNVNYAPPNKYKEEMLSSKVSGEDRGLSVNQFSYANFNFYNEYIGLFREMISPLSDVAFSYYHFYLYETFKDKNGYTINKIRVKPKSGFTPCFNGFIYIIEDLYNIQSLDFTISGKSIKNALLDSINIKQVYVPSIVDKNYWNLITQNVEFKIKVFAFKTRGSFNYIFKNYNYEKQFGKDFFNNELFVVKDDAIKNDSSYWLKNRPIELTFEERNDYVRKDSISKVTSSPAYLDSMDRKNNRFKFVDLFFGYNAANSIKKIRYGIANPISSIGFNAVEGTNIGLRPYLSKRNEDDLNVYNAQADVSYGFSDKKLKYSLDVVYNHAIRSLSSLRVGFGNDYYQYNEQGIISEYGNTFYSLVAKENAAKLFQKKYIKASWASEILNGLYINLTTEYAVRNSLTNTTEFSWFSKDKLYAANQPFSNSGELYVFDDKMLKQSITLQWSPDQKYQTFPTYKNRIRSEWPTVYLFLDRSFGLTKDFVDYTKLRINVIDNYVSTKRFGYLKYRLEAGKFLTNEETSAVDYFHFRGNNLIGGFRSPYLNTFKLQNGYNFSTTNDYAAVWVEQYFDGFFNDKIPILNKLGITGIWSVSMLKQKDLTYIEPGIGIEGIKLGAIDIMRVDYFWGIANGVIQDKGIRLGFSTFFESIFGR